MVSIDIAILGDVSRMTSPIRRAICNVERQVMSIVRQGNQNRRKKMSSVLSNALVVLSIIPFRFTTIFGWCDRYSSPAARTKFVVHVGVLSDRTVYIYFSQ